jgi:protein gp37
MGKDSAIEWCHHTFNPWWGCSRVSPGCEHCYAETFDKRVNGKDKAHWGVKAERRFFGDKHWAEPLKWNAAAAKVGERHRVFCASMADVFEDRDSLRLERVKLFRLISTTPHLDWLLLTKRPENADRLWSDAHYASFNGADSLGPTWAPNVWLGTTVEDQKRANERIPHLLRVPAAVRFLSCEPLLEHVTLWDNDNTGGAWRGPGVVLSRGMTPSTPNEPSEGYDDSYVGIDWVICGGESGHSARPMRPEWARSLRDQCVAAGVPFLFKQWGEHDGELKRIGKKVAGRDLDGRTWDEYPTVGARTMARSEGA